MTNKSLNKLVVDDDEEDFILIRDLLRPVARTEHAATLAAALDHLERQAYDLLLFDYRLGRGVGPRST